jgi:peptide/nickel transport system ATP-binding protein
VSAQPESRRALSLTGEGLVKHYPAFRGRGQVVHALDGVTVHLASGKTLGVVGESGSGKSTIARVLCLLTPPTAGVIRLDGRAVDLRNRQEVRRYRRHVQMVFQDPFSSINPANPIEYTLARPLVLHGRAHGRRELEERLEHLLEMVGLTPPDEFLAKYPHELSGGQRQRVGFARALATGSRVLLADEPVSMLDVSIRAGILNLMAGLRDREGLSLMYITHDLASARYLSDEILVMYAGEAVEFAPAEALVAEPLHPYAQLLLSSVPDPDAVAEETPPVGVTSEPPNMVSPPSGCRFHPRCPYVMDRCRTESPAPTEGEGGRWVRCHLYGPGAVRTAPPEPPPSVGA